MKKFIVIFLFFITGIQSTLQADIKKVNSFQEMTQYCTNNTLVLVDLDKCLFNTKTQFGSANWFYHNISTIVKNGYSKVDAIKEFYPQYIDSQRSVDVELIDPKASEVIRSLQDKGLIVMGFTHRQPSVRFSTIRQLEKIGVDFKKNFPISGEIILDYRHNPRFFEGTLFIVDYNEKGAVLKAFLPKIDKTFDRIVYIDDGIKHLQSVQKALRHEPIDLVSLHYNPVGSDFDAHQRAIAKIQEKLNGKILSDEAAEVLLNH